MSADLLSPEEALQKGDNYVCIALDKDVIDGLYRLRDDLGFPVGSMLSSVLRTFVAAFLPLAALHSQGKLTVYALADVVRVLEPLLMKSEAAKARADREIKKLQREQKIAAGGGQ